MAGVIEIRDKENGFLTVTLKDLLALSEPEGRNLIWSIQDLEAVGDPEKLKADLIEIEEKATQSPHGLIMKWEDLVDLAGALKDVLECLDCGLS